MTQETDGPQSAEGKEQELPTSTELNEEGCEEADVDFERVEPNKIESRSDDQMKKSPDVTEGGKRFRRHSAPQEEESMFCCCICQSSLGGAGQSSSLSCGHGICLFCLRNLMTSHFMCPICLKRGNRLECNTGFQTSQSPRSKSLSNDWNEIGERGEKLSKLSLSRITPRLAYPFFSNIICKLLVGFVVAWILITQVMIYNWLDLNHSLCMTTCQLNQPLHSELEKWPLHSKLEKWPTDTIFNRPDEAIRTGFKNLRKNILKHCSENKLPFWLTETCHIVSISAMYLTSTSTPTFTSHPSAILSLVPAITHTQDLTITPTPPLSRVPSVLLDDPMVETTIYPPLLMESENYCMGDTEDCNMATSEMDPSTPVCHTLDNDCPTEPGASCVQGTVLPGCVHDSHEVEKHCTLCDVWACLFCSRANFISTMGLEHLVQRRLQTTEQQPGVGYSPLHCTYSMELNWWLRNMRHEYAFPVIPQTLPTQTIAYEGSSIKLDSSDSVQNELDNSSYKTIKKKAQFVFSAFGQIVLTATSRVSLKGDAVMKYLNNFYISSTIHEGVQETCLIHHDALVALRGIGTHIRNIEAMSTICQGLQLEIRKIQETLASKKAKTCLVHTSKSAGMLVGRQPAGSRVDSQSSFLDKQYQDSEAGLRSQSPKKIDSAEYSKYKEIKKEWQQLQPGASCGSECKLGKARETRYERSVVSTGGAQPNIDSRTSNQNCMDTSLVHTGGARPKTSTKRGKTRRKKTSMSYA